MFQLLLFQGSPFQGSPFQGPPFQGSLFQGLLFQSPLLRSLPFQLYAGGGAIALGVYLTLWMRDRTTPMTDRGSWLVLLLATVFWPIVLPISVFTELLPRWREGRSR